MLKFEGGKWVRYGASVAGPQPQGIYEDRVTMLVDDGSVPEFARYGGYVAVGDRMRFFTNEAKPDEVKAQPYLGQKRKQTEVGKYLPATRSDINDWASVVPEDQLAALRKAGISSTCGIGGRTGRVRLTSRTISTCSSYAVATPGKDLSPTTGIWRSDSRASCSTRKRPVGVR
jgi:hypothetical protein